METGNAEVKCKRSLEMEPSKERKNFKVSIQVVPTQIRELLFVFHALNLGIGERPSYLMNNGTMDFNGLESTHGAEEKPGPEEKPSVKKWDIVIKYNRKQKDVQKATGPGNNGYPQSETRSADQIDDKAPSKQFTGTETSACLEMEQKEQEGCLAPTTSEPHAGFEVSVRQDPSFDSQEELLPEKMVQDGQVLEKETTKILIHEVAQDGRVLEKERTKISSHEVAQDGQLLDKELTKSSSHEVAQKERHDSLKVRVAELRQETSMLSRELQKHATMCMQLSDANRLLMDELKKMCEPCVIDILEGKNPDNNPQTD